MTPTATRRRNGTAPKAAASSKAKPPAKTATKGRAAAKPRRGPAAAAKKTLRMASEAVEEHTPDVPTPNRFARELAGKAIKKMASGALEAGAGIIRAAADRAASTGHEAADKAARTRLPIQRHIDIAVPIRVAWEEWMALDCLPEGVHAVTKIERDGNELSGRTSGPRPSDWAAEIIDEREQQSFAWQSHEGSDCAGLATFHDLSKRLTRIELTLDVVPTSLAETFELTLHLADKKAEKELRRLKVRLELINPDLYDTEDEGADAQDAEGGDAEDKAPEDEAPDGEDETPENSEEDMDDEQDEAA